MAEKKFVKCEDCGRRLPGPPRRCDVCGGKMSYKVEDSYYTPEGVISKHNYEKSVRKTPDRDFNYTEKAVSKSKKQTGYTSHKNRTEPIIDRIGDAVDVLADSDGLDLESIKKIGNTLTGAKSSTGSTQYSSKSKGYGNAQSSQSGRNLKQLIIYIIGIIVFVSFISVLAWNSENPDYEDYGYDEDGVYFEDGGYDESHNADIVYSVYETVYGDGYTLTLNEIVQGVEDDDPDTLYAYGSLEITDNVDLEITPYNQFAIEFDGRSSNKPEYVSIGDSDFDANEVYSNDIDEISMEPENIYFFTVCYKDAAEWSELNFIHNLRGSLADRNKSLDIFMDDW